MSDQDSTEPHNILKDPCVHCGKSTAFGSGRFVDRIGYDEGWACAECMTINSDEEDDDE